ncbi:MAG: GGDEF domain-containing protein [Sulfuricellaceae bacterium]|nr:GGDEF domain-containing protein [Sulfuricellaceae bacterium]
MNVIDHKLSSASILDSLIAITRDSDRDAMFGSLVCTMREMFESDEVALYWVLPTSDGHEAWLVASDNPQQGLVITSQQAGTATPVPLSSNQAFAESFREQTCVSRPLPQGDHVKQVHPISAHGEVVGLLEIQGPALGEVESRLIRGFLQIFRNYIQIIDESERDTLTGLLNRRTFDKNIGKVLLATRDETELSGGKRQGSRAKARWLAVLDVDHFKLVNDKYGHLYGDEVLLLLAGLMRKTFRNTDMLYRFGGEEFVIAMNFTDLNGAKSVLERLRKTVEAYDFPQVGRVTVSIGYVRIDDQDAPSTVVGHADEALYYAKHNGRNRVCSYDELVSAGELSAAVVNMDVELF